MKMQSSSTMRHGCHARSSVTAVPCGRSLPLKLAAPSAASLPGAYMALPRSPVSAASPVVPRALPVMTQQSSNSSPHAAAPAAASAQKRPLNVIIAGAGVGGLVLAVALIKKGCQVTVLERDLTAIRGEGKYRGPIQIQSNALGALEAIDPDVADEILAEGCITGDRVNGLVDGLTGEWYVKFDTFHPAADQGLPVTRVISRVSLQNILANAVFRYSGPDAIIGNSHVTSFSETTDPSTGCPAVSVTLDDGRVYTGDVLVGADGIWSKIRKQMIGESDAHYSEYTCYTGISDFTPADIDVVGYRVFLGNAQYFVSSDVGGGKMQWYAFHKEPAGGTDKDGMRKHRLLQLFGHWNDNVVDLIKATPEEDILRRDIFDRAPVFKWSEGRTVLLGDSVHAMQPNLGQGGCMAIEDAYELANDISEALEKADNCPAKLDVQSVFQHYQNQRMLRASAIHGMAGMAAFMASTYKAYLGEGMPGPLASLTKLKIPHPGRLVGQLVMKLTMPSVLGWVLGGNVDNIQKNRHAHCRISDHPRAFSESQFPLFMRDDSAIVQAANASWLLATERAAGSGNPGSNGRVDLQADATSTSEAKGIYLTDRRAVVGRSTRDGADLVVDDGSVAPQHAHIWRSAAASSLTNTTSFEYHVQDLGSHAGTWLNGRQLAQGGRAKLNPGDILEFGRSPSNEVYKVKMQHSSQCQSDLCGDSFTTLNVSKRSTEMAIGSKESRQQSMALL